MKTLAKFCSARILHVKVMKTIFKNIFDSIIIAAVHCKRITTIKVTYKKKMTKLLKNWLAKVGRVSGVRRTQNRKGYQHTLNLNNLLGMTCQLVYHCVWPLL